MILQAGIRDSIRKPTGRFLLASAPDSVASRPTHRFWKTGAELGFFLARFHVALRKQLLLLARFRAVDCLLGGSSCRFADCELRGECQRLYSRFFSGQAVDNTKACSRSCSGSKDERVGLTGVVAILSVVLARRTSV